jgi:hypothetical protein
MAKLPPLLKFCTHPAHTYGSRRHGCHQDGWGPDRLTRLAPDWSRSAVASRGLQTPLAARRQSQGLHRGKA